MARVKSNKNTSKKNTKNTKNNKKDTSIKNKQTKTNNSVKKIKTKSSKKKRKFVKKYKIEILDVLLLMVFTIIITSFTTGLLFNMQYKKNRSLNEALLYSDSFSQLAKVYEEVKNNYYEEVNEEDLAGAALSGMLDYLKDKYSIYLNTDDSAELATSLDGAYEGLGIVCQEGEIIYIYDNSPASKAGFKTGDIIIKINNTVIGEDNNIDIGEYINKDKSNTIVVMRGKKEYTFKVSVEKVVLPTVTKNILEKNDKKIGYLKVSSFSAYTYSQLQDELKDLEKDGIDSLIIDLRNNVGGYLSSVTKIANLFLEKGKIIYYLEDKESKEDYKDDTKEKRDYEIVVLINSNTASAAEVLTSALKDSYGAIIVGEKSYGKGKVQTMLKYGNSIVKYTSAKWLRPNGECVDEFGIEPDYAIKNEVKGNTIYDNQLEKAIDLLKLN